MKRRVQKRGVHTKSRSLIPRGRRGQRYLREEILPAPPNSLQTLKNRSIFKTMLSQNIIKTIDTDSLRIQRRPRTTQQPRSLSQDSGPTIQSSTRGSQYPTGMTRPLLPFAVIILNGATLRTRINTQRAPPGLIGLANRELQLNRTMLRAQQRSLQRKLLHNSAPNTLPNTKS
jgi:hypothetical protein